MKTTRVDLEIQSTRRFEDFPLKDAEVLKLAFADSQLVRSALSTEEPTTGGIRHNLSRHARSAKGQDCAEVCALDQADPEHRKLTCNKLAKRCLLVHDSLCCDTAVAVLDSRRERISLSRRDRIDNAKRRFRCGVSNRLLLATPKHPLRI